MKSKPVEFLLVDLGVEKTHSRPYTSTDNPYLEAVKNGVQGRGQVVKETPETGRTPSPNTTAEKGRPRSRKRRFGSGAPG